MIERELSLKVSFVAAIDPALQGGDDTLCLELRVGEGDGKCLLPGEHRDLPAEFFGSPHDKRARPESVGRQGEREERRAAPSVT